MSDYIYHVNYIFFRIIAATVEVLLVLSSHYLEAVIFLATTNSFSLLFFPSMYVTFLFFSF